VRKSRIERRGISIVLALALVLITAASAQAARPVLVAKYEAATFNVTGTEGTSYLRKSGNNPRFTSAGSLLIMYGTGGVPQTASITVDTTADANRIILPVRGQECSDPAQSSVGHWPHFTVAVDGSEVISTYATRLMWQRATARVDVPAGHHTFTITYDNDLSSQGVCDRNLRVDYIALYRVGTDAPPHPQTVWAPIGSKPLSDAEAASLVTHEPEIRPENAAANNYVPTDAELAAFHTAQDPSRPPVDYNPLSKYVTGRPGLVDPSTDDLIQWAAHKWGIPEDLIRAQMATESWWRQSTLGDRATVSPTAYGQYPPQARIAGTSDVYESMGISQIKWRPDGSLHTGTDPLRWKSVAFNLDFYAATIRFYYDGLCSWCTTGYSAGQEWNSVGAWFNPQPWLNLGQLNYIDRVQGNLADSPWDDPAF
jgi:Ca-dependent carbohydrate-binding module xylan-binding